MDGTCFHKDQEVSSGSLKLGLTGKYIVSQTQQMPGYELSNFTITFSTNFLFRKDDLSFDGKTLVSISEEASTE